jgi:predicted HicB family RNase H-like nuclease
VVHFYQTVRKGGGRKMKSKKIILNATEPVHKAIKVAAANAGKSINDLCLTTIEKHPEVRRALNDGK